MKVTIRESSLFIPLGRGGGGGRGLGQIMRDGEEETFEVFPCGEGVGGVVTVST